MKTSPRLVGGFAPRGVERVGAVSALAALEFGFGVQQAWTGAGSWVGVWKLLISAKHMG